MATPDLDNLQCENCRFLYSLGQRAKDSEVRSERYRHIAEQERDAARESAKLHLHALTDANAKIEKLQVRLAELQSNAHVVTIGPTRKLQEENNYLREQVDWLSGEVKELLAELRALD